MTSSGTPEEPRRGPGRPRIHPRKGRPPVYTSRERAIKTLFSPRYQAFLAGEIRIEDLSLDELSKGVINDEGRNHTSHPPEFIPRAFALACTAELRRRLQAKFEAAAARAIDVIVEVMESGEGEQYDQYSRAGTGRLKAAQEVINRVMGKVPDKIEAQVTLTPWEQMGEGAELIIDVEIEDLPEEE